MRQIFLVFLIGVVFIAGCADSRSVAVASLSGDDTVIIENGEVSKISEVDPEATEVRVWLCTDGKFTFDNESCYDAFYDIPLPRTTIQEAIGQKYPSLKIIRILRGRERSGSLDYTVYYVSLKK